ncbi:MAG TPA: hypothetical protein VGP46_12045, partial [Acidimicrobiales bacterium]|nr:hypothetical protein [Acidimicrobiales bacterium]
MRDLLDLTRPFLPSGLVAPDTVPYFLDLAETLPEFRAAGFECRLASGDDRVDLQVGVSTEEGQPAVLLDFARSRRHAGQAWAALARLCEKWASAGSSLNEGIAEVWLELDRPGTQGCPTAELGDLVPSVFVVLRPTSNRAALAVADEISSTLVPEGQALGGVLDRLSDACPTPACISHIGVMFGRDLPAMRVHVSPLPLQGLATFLADVAWGGDIAEVSSLARWLLAYGDLVVLCLDVVGDVLPRAGLECFFHQRRGVDPRWVPLLSRLVALNLADPEKTDCLLRWPGTLIPPDNVERWPQRLVVESLLQPADAFGQIERRLSHVKLTSAPGAPVTAKAYFGFGHVWARPGDSSTKSAGQGGRRW